MPESGRLSAMSDPSSQSYSLQPQRPITVKDLTIGVGATLVFFCLLLVVPMMGVVASVVTPLPTLLGFYRWGRPTGYWIPLGSLGISAALLALTGLFQTLVYLSELLLLGLLVAKGMRQQWAVASIVGWAGGTVFVIGGLLFWLAHGGGGAPLFAGLEGEVRVAMSALLEQYGGADNVQMTALKHSLEAVVPFVVRLLPGLAAGSILLIAWFNLLLASHFCRLHRLPLPAWPAWNQWKSPELLVWPLIAAMFLVLMGHSIPQLLGFNLLIVLGVIYLLHGLAVVAFYFERWKLPGLVRGLGYGLIFLQQLVSLVVMVLGLFDLWLDFRRLAKKPVSDAS